METTTTHPTTTLLDGLLIGESGRWHDGRLWLAHWGTHDVLAVDVCGRTEKMAHSPVTLPFCFDWLPDGRLLIVNGTTVLRQEPDGSLVTHADLSGIAAGFNEILVDERGNAYVNGSDFDFMGGGPFVPGVVVLVTPDGQVRQVADDIHFGNGMVISPDGRTLIVAESFAGRLAGFDIEPDGGLANRRVWAEVPGLHPDGLAIDAEGAVWAASMGACVRVAEGGAVLARVEIGNSAFACALGGADGRTLFVMTARWRGAADVFSGEPTGKVVTARVRIPAARC